MFLNNYWKYKMGLDKNFGFNSSGYQTTGSNVGLKNYSGVSFYMFTKFSINEMTYANYYSEVPKQVQGLSVGVAVKFGAGEQEGSVDDYAISGTDITSDFVSTTISSTPSVDEGFTYDIVISAIYNGSGTTLKRIGITKDVYGNTNSSVETTNLTGYKIPVLMISHELSEPITLNNGDPVNIIMKITQS